MYQKLSDLRKRLIISIYIDFLRFCFPFFYIHWLMGDDLLPANPFGNAHRFRASAMGFQPVTQVGRCVGEVADPLSDRAFLRSHVVLRKFLLACILLVINYISFSKQFT